MHSTSRLLAGALVLSAVCLPFPAHGQSRGTDRVYLPVDSEAAGNFKRLEEMAKRGQWARVVKALDQLLKEGGDKLLQTGKGYRSIRSEARRRLQALGGRGRAAYDLIHEDAARRLYRSGLQAADTRPFVRILAEHPASSYAAKARVILASRYVEQGRPDAALVHTHWLLQRGKLGGEERLRLSRLGILALALAGRRGEALNAIDALKAAESIKSTYRRYTRVLAPAPRRVPPNASAVSWRRDVFGFYEVSAQGSLPWSVPGGDVATGYVHDGSHALAVSLESGKLLWRTALREENAFERPAGQCQLALGQGVVLCVLPGRGGLVGLERQGGRRMWGKTLDQLKREAGVDFKAHLAETAAPQVMGDVAVVLLVTEHADREVHALGVDLFTGKLAWKVFLASETHGAIPFPVMASAGRRVFVGTGQGALAALDAHGEILWMQRYRSKRDTGRRGRGRWRGFRGRFGRGRPAPARPKPSRLPTMAVAGGTLWMSPEDADAFLAFDVASGTARGIVRARDPRILGPRGEGLVAYAENSIVKVTRAGTRVLAQVGAGLLGRPVVVQDYVFMPRKDGVMQVHLAQKRMKQVFKWPAGRGHLLASGGRLLVATPRALFAYGQPHGTVNSKLTPLEAVKSLGDERFAVRELASKTLLQSGEVARAGLLKATRSSDPEVALRAEFILGELDRATRLERWKPLVKAEWGTKVPDLLNRLTHPNPGVRLKALAALGTIKNDPAVLVLMAELMEDRDSRVAFTAAGTLLKRGNRKGMKLVRKMLLGGVTSDRRQAAGLLVQYGNAGDVEILAQALKDKHYEVRALAVSGVLKLGGGRSFPRVKPLIDDPHPAVRKAVLGGLKYAVKDSDEALALLSKAARDKDGSIRALAVKTLAQSKSPRAYAALGWALADPVKATAKIAAEALYSVVQTKNALLVPIKAIEKAAQNKDAYYRNYVAQIALRFVDQGGALSVPTLTRFMGDPHHQIRGYMIGGKSWAHMLLERVGKVTLQGGDIAAVTTLTLNGDENIRIQAYQCIAEAQGGAGRGRILAQGLADAHPTIRRECAEWLMPYDASKPNLLTPGAVQEVLQVAVDAQRAEGRQAAATLLQRIPDARLFPGLLRFLLETGDDKLRLAGAQQLAARTKGQIKVDKNGDLRAATNKLAVWWFHKRYPKMVVAKLLKDLQSDVPAFRYQAGKLFAELPLPKVRDALIRSLPKENLAWVLKVKLKALVAITGQRFGFEESSSMPALRACAKRFRAWHRKLTEKRRGLVPR